jgi:hypothetical protein
MLKVNDWVEKVMRVQEPFKRANRAFHPDDSVIDVSRGQDWRQEAPGHGRTLQRGIQGPDYQRGQVGEAGRGHAAPGRRF